MIFGRDSRLHEQTVQAVARGDLKRVRARVKTPVYNQVTVTVVDRRVWKTAMKLAGGDRSRIVVRSTTEVVVVNQSKRK